MKNCVWLSVCIVYHATGSCSNLLTCGLESLILVISTEGHACPDVHPLCPNSKRSNELFGDCLM